MVKGKFYVEEKEGSDLKVLVWQPEVIEKYEYSKLPLEPLPLPVDESDVSEVSSSDDEECGSYDSSLVLTK